MFLYIPIYSYTLFSVPKCRFWKQHRNCCSQACPNNSASNINQNHLEKATMPCFLYVFLFSLGSSSMGAKGTGTHINILFLILFWNFCFTTKTCKKKLNHLGQWRGRVECARQVLIAKLSSIMEDLPWALSSCSSWLCWRCKGKGELWVVCSLQGAWSTPQDAPTQGGSCLRTGWVGRWVGCFCLLFISLLIWSKMVHGSQLCGLCGCFVCPDESVPWNTVFAVAA